MAEENRLQASRALTVLALLLFALLAVSSWTVTNASEKPSWMEWGERYSKEKPVRGGYYRAAAYAYIGLMNPNHWPVNDWVSMGMFYEKLVYTDGQYKPAAPWLAESWEYEDPVTVVMQLRKGVAFHDGSPFNAESVKYQMDWIMDPASGAWSRTWLEPLKSVEVVDEHTLRWRFKRPWGAFLGVIANVPGYVMSAQALQQGGPKALDHHAVGTGPYILEEGKPGNYLKVKRNPDWWFGKSVGHPDMPYFDGVKVTVIPDPAIQLANLRAAKIDFMVLSKTQYEMVKDDPSLNIFVTPINHVASMRFNLVEGPCKDIRVRQAISHAIDRKAIIAGTQFGLGRLASCMYPDDHWCHNPDLEPVPYDPEKAKKLLAEAGYSDGLKITGYTTPLYATIGEVVKAMLMDVGIDWEMEMEAGPAATDRMRNLEYDFAPGGWAWIFDPDLMATGLYHPDGGFNYGRSENEQAIELIMAGRRETDSETRKKIYWDLEKVLYENYEDAWLFWEVAATAYRSNVMGLNREMFLKDREVFAWSHPLWFKGGKP